MEQTRLDTLLLCALLAVSLLLRLPYVGTERLWPDEALYARIARDFIADPATILQPAAYSDHLPIVPVFLSLGLLFANNLAGLRTMTLLLNLLGIFATYQLGRRIAGSFVGLCAALFLAVNVGYFCHSQLILIDGPFTVAQLGLALALLNVRAEAGWDRHDLRVGLIATGLAALKWYAPLMIAPVLLAYYMVACRDLALVPRLRKLLLPASCLAAFSVPYLAWKLRLLGQHGGISSYFQQPATYYLQIMATFVGGPVSLGVVLVGAFFLLRQAPRVRVLIGAVIVVGLVVMSLAPERDERYIQPILPFLGILFALGAKSAVDTLVREKAYRAGARAVAIGLVCLQFIPFLQQKDRTSLADSYTGFLEAGQVVRGLATPDALILAGSLRAMKYAVGREQEGRVAGLPPTLEGLRSVTQRHRGRIILETDCWEYTQPAWLYPWSRAKLERLESAGFREGALIQRSVSGTVEPVVLVFIRD